MAGVKLVPWQTLVAALWAAITCGFLYTFSTFSTALRDVMGLSESQLSTVGTAQVVVGLVTFVTGLVVDKVGIFASICGGAILNGAAWFCVGAIAMWDLQVPHPAVLVAFLAAFATFSAAHITAAVFKVLTQNFNRQRSVVIGIAKAWVGVASGLLTTIYTGFHPGSAEDPERLKYIWYLSASSLLLPLLTSPLLRPLDVSTVQSIEAGRDGLLVPPPLRVPLLTLLTLTLVAVTATAALLADSLSGEWRLGFSCALLVIAASPAILLLPAAARDSSARGGIASPVPVQHVSLATVSPSEDIQDHPSLSTAIQHASPWECGPAQLVRKPAAWALWFTIFSIQAGGFLLTTNLGQIVESRSGPRVAASTAVTVFSCAQSLGRLSGGMWSDVVVRRMHMPRPWCFVVLLAQMALAQLMLCIPGPAPLYGGVALAGMAFGLTYPLMIVSIAELFGQRRIAPNYMIFDGSPGATATLLIAKYFVGAEYARHTEPGASACIGDECFRMSHLSVACLQLLALFGAVWLARSSRVVYRTSVWGSPSGDAEELAKSSPGPETFPVGASRADGAGANAADVNITIRPLRQSS